MRRIFVLAAVLLLEGCAQSAVGPPRPRPSPTVSQPATFERYAGAYQTAAGPRFIINGRGELLDLENGANRQLYATLYPDRLTFGPGYFVPAPPQATLAFHFAGSRADLLTFTPVGGNSVIARRMAFKETEVMVQADGATLAGTVTEPLTPAPHPGIVLVHGSGPGFRIDYGVWVNLYATFGLSVLAYDKRGNGASTGRYPGEQASDTSLDIYASDAAAAMRFLAGYSGVDSKRLGFYGGSQGGWIAPLAMQRYHAPAAFAILASSPAVSVDQQELWASFSGSSTALPTMSEAEMLAQVRAAPASVYDPRPVLAALSQPMLWINGSADRQVPTIVNSEILRSLHHPQWDIEVLPGVDHGLLLNPSGIEPDQRKAARFASGLFQLIAGWLVRTVGVTPTAGIGS